jgi:hypothetical protein
VSRAKRKSNRAKSVAASRARASAALRAEATAPTRSRFRLPDGSRSVTSPWVWRGFVMMALIALGLCITLFVGGKVDFGAAWAVITAAWLATGMWLWRQHLTTT